MKNSDSSGQTKIMSCDCDNFKPSDNRWGNCTEYPVGEMVSTKQDCTGWGCFKPKETQTKKTCEHVGKVHPMNFQCLDCEDTADECNCNYTAGVFCDLCQEIIWIGCDEVRDLWYKNHPHMDLFLEKYKIQGLIKDYDSSSTTKTEGNKE